jgi:hypothetical protein
LEKKKKNLEKFLGVQKKEKRKEKENRKRKENRPLVGPLSNLFACGNV